MRIETVRKTSETVLGVPNERRATIKTRWRCPTPGDDPRPAEGLAPPRRSPLRRAPHTGRSRLPKTPRDFLQVRRFALDKPMKQKLLESGTAGQSKSEVGGDSSRGAAQGRARPQLRTCFDTYWATSSWLPTKLFGDVSFGVFRFGSMSSMSICLKN